MSRSVAWMVAVLVMLVCAGTAVADDTGGVTFENVTWLWSETHAQSWYDADIEIYPIDLDGDGREDAILKDNDEIIAKRGYDGEHLWERSGIGDLILVGDLDGDGGEDILDHESVTAIRGLDGTDMWDWWGWVSTVIPAGDISGDGKKDVIIIERSDSDYVEIGDDVWCEDVSIYALNGTDGSIIWEIWPWTISSWTWFDSNTTVSVPEVLPTQDLNGDNKDDIAVILSVVSVVEFMGTFEEHSTQVILLDSANVRHELGSKTFHGDFLSLTPAGDLDGDNMSDMILKIGNDMGDNTTIAISVGELLIWGGESMLWGEDGNFSVIPAGDLDGDGKEDVLLNYFDEEENGWDTAVAAKRGYDGSNLWEKSISDFIRVLYYGSEPPWYISVIPAGDVDHDGKQDVLVNALRGELEEVQLSGKSTAAVIRGYDGTELWRVGESWSDEGISALPAGDVDGDGTDDVLVHWLVYGSFFAQYNTETIIAKRGYDGIDLWSVYAYKSQKFLWIAPRCDLNGDYKNDTIVAYWDSGYSGAEKGKHIYALTVGTAGAVDICSISPDYGLNITAVNVTIFGHGFAEGIAVNLTMEGEENILGEDVVVISEYEITTKFNLTGRATGLWDVIVRLPCGEESRITEGFEIRGFLYGIFPKYGFNVTEEQLVTIYGSGFAEGVIAKLTKEDEEDIEGENTEVLSKTRFTTKFNLTGKETGLWDVVVTLPGGEEDCLTYAFEIRNLLGGGYLLQAGEYQEYEIQVPETANLFITFQKTTLVSYGNSWQGKLSLLKDGEEIAIDSGTHDLILHIVDPEPGVYTVKVMASQTGSGILAVRTSLPELPLGEWVVDTIHCSYGSVWYQVDVPPDQDTLYFEAEGMGLWSHFDIYYGEYGCSEHWRSPDARDDRRTSIKMPDPVPGTYVVEFMDSAMIQGDRGYSEDQTRDVLVMADITSSIQPPPDYLPTITCISPDSGGNTGFATIEVKGGWLDPNATVSLTRSGYYDIIAQNVYGSDNGTTLSATSNLIGKEHGEWNLVVTNPDGRSVTAPGSFSIEEGGEPELWVEIVGREKVRTGRQAKYILRYGNSGDVDMPAHFFNISASGVSYPIFQLLADPQPKEETLNVLGKGTTGSPGILPPGSSYSIPFYLETQNSGDTFDLSVFAMTTNPISSNLVSHLDATCPAPGISLVFTRIFSQDVSSYSGPFGDGWIHNYEIRLEEFSDGTIALLRGDSYLRFFLNNDDGTYTAIRDYSTLTQNPDGTYQLEEKDGTIYSFRTDLMFDYIEDLNGNRISAVYDSNDQLIELQHSCGESFTIEYDADGRITRLIDHIGRVTEYQYDDSADLLMSATTSDGAVTDYSYTSTDGGNYVLSSISYPEGIQQFFEYGGTGVLSKEYLDGGEELIRYSYDLANGTAYITDAEGNVATTHLDVFGQINWLEDPLGAVIHYEYDENFNLIRITDPLGNLYNFSHDEQGNVISATNPPGHETAMDYSRSFNKLTWLRDGRGNEMTFDYDEHSNLLSTNYPDSSIESMDYDSMGNPTSVTTRKGDTIHYTRNSKGQLTRKDYPDGSWITYGYDDAGNMISAADDSGTIWMEYDTRNRLTRITHPAGHFFNYSYDDAGRLIQRVDQNGNALNYEYDAASRLVRISNESDSDIVWYRYDVVGRLTRKTLSSGAYTTYEYDAASRILHLINYNASGGVLSQFDYTYNLLGNPVLLNTLEGIYNYEYDSIGQLTKVTYPDGHYVSYSYDASGNRITVVDDGATSDYTTNNMNQYTDVGDVSYSYDDNGNLISRTEDGQTTTYKYNFENRLTMVTSPEGTWEYVYDALGSRVGVIHNGVEHRYLVDPMGFGDVAAEYDGDGSLIARYIHGLGLISQIDSSGSLYYYHFNPTGHTMEITDEDGDVVNSYKYSPFGISLEKEETIPNPFEYVGEFGVMDDGNGLTYMRMRYYQPELGRFSSEDPLRIPGNNDYTYVENKAIAYVDVFGLQSYDSDVMPVGTGKYVMPVWWTGNTGNKQWLTPQQATQGLREGTYGTGDGTPWVHPYDMTLPITPDKFLRPDITTPAVTAAFGAISGIYMGLIFRILAKYTTLLPPILMPATERVESVGSDTPEDKYGPSGFDLPDTPPEERKRFILPDQNFYYKVDFWNKEDATAPACDVYVKDQLDTNLNWSTLRFEEIGFLNWTVDLEPCQYFNVYVDTRPEMDLIVNVEGNLNPDTGVLNWTFWSLDPGTLEMPEDPMAGFLPPITESGYEVGWVCFSVDPEPSLPTGIQIQNQAFVEFDWAGDLLDHPAPKEGPWINTIDVGVPASEVNDLPAEVPPEFAVSWSGDDDAGGAGIVSYDIYVSDNGGPFGVWLGATTLTEETFSGENGHTYAFYSIARDGVGHVEDAPEESDATTFIAGPTNQHPVSDPNGPYAGTEGIPITFDGSSSYDPDGTIDSYEWNFGDGNTSTEMNPTYTYAQNGTYTITLNVTDSDGATDTNTTTATIEDTEPTADFTGTPRSGPEPLTVDFSDNSTSYDGITAWEWDFDNDGGVDSNDQNPTHEYAEDGTYTVTLTVYESDDDNDTLTLADYITVTGAGDTIPPTIVSVTLDAYTTIANATIHLTVNATDNVGVTSVTADGSSLTEDGDNWTGELRVPSTATPREYSVMIQASDAALNTAESTVAYTVVIPQGGVGIDLIPTDTMVSSGTSVTIMVKVTNTENFDDTFDVELTYDNIPDAYSDYRLDFNWTDWHDHRQQVSVNAKSSIEVPLTITVPSGESGYKLYSVTARSMNWVTVGSNTGGILIT